MADLTPAILARNQDTIQNIRLWDERPLLQTYQQTQAIRLYYKFYNVHVDRYHLADGYHQVMLSTRELSPELPAQAQTWVNQNLEFTHGFGLVMNFVSKSIGGGFPEYLVQNVPPQSDLRPERPSSRRTAFFTYWTASPASRYGAWKSVRFHKAMCPGKRLGLHSRFR